MTPIIAVFKNGVFRPIGPVDLPEGSTVRIEPVASALAGGIRVDGPWTEAKNERRCVLIEREIDGTLTPEETAELKGLQEEMLRYRRRVAPLPFEDAQKLQEELLATSL
jgi:predicted DNA-binding antitoxin AbrB/MazE fold protein